MGQEELWNVTVATGNTTVTANTGTFLHYAEFKVPYQLLLGFW